MAPRRKKNLSDFERSMDKNHRNLADRMTSNYLRHSPDDILVFLDETGDVKPTKHEDFLAVCGCAFVGSHYNHILKHMWSVMRRCVFKLSPETCFHATDHLRHVDEPGLIRLESFLRNGGFAPLYSFDTFQIRYNVEDGYVKAAMLSNLAIIEEQLLQQFGKTAEEATWIFEKSKKLSHFVVAQSLSAHAMATPTFHQVKFMDKDSREPGLEIADLITYVCRHHIIVEYGSIAGSNWEDGKKPQYDSLFRAAFASWPIFNPDIQIDH